MKPSCYRMVISFLLIDDGCYPYLVFGQGADEASIVSEAYLNWMFGEEEEFLKERQDAKNHLTGLSLNQVKEYAEGQGVLITSLLLTSDMLS